MRFQLDEAMEVLARTPAVLAALLRGLSDGWVSSNYGADTFSPFDVVGHLIHGERTDWMVRLRLILAHGEDRPFEPFLVPTPKPEDPNAKPKIVINGGGVRR